ncbi:MAG: UDP-glucose/GDP-mannose dehydrogenase family protein [Alphaproteobacteria bacterium]|nr:UDP-glucose/GDP-mannose dehydrogenase family protein [Alphaproteobacteria bacterium]
MKICVQGLWHLGSVTAACLADAGFITVGLDDDARTVDNLKRAVPPLFEPGLAELVQSGLEAGRLSFTTDAAAAVADADLVWITFDTPVDDEDRADVDFVRRRVESLFPYLKDGAAVLVSSQMPVGSVRGLATRFAAAAGGRRVGFACSPENLRLGKAIEVFKQPERIVIGTDDAADGGLARRRIEPVAGRFCPHLMWVSIEAAEMVKHALNAFLATCVTFINEVATVCEQVGADAAEVEAALRAEPRVGRKCYIRPGAAFAGGTLARDVTFLAELAERHGLSLPLLGGILPSNQVHRNWPLRRLTELLGGVAGRRIAVLGLAYKPGTDAIRRSVAIELAYGLVRAGARVTSFDPVVRTLPDDLAGRVTLETTLGAALAGAEALVIATEWPEFKALTADQLVGTMTVSPLVLDQNRFLGPAVAGDPRLRYVTIGKPG